MEMSNLMDKIRQRIKKLEARINSLRIIPPTDYMAADLQANLKEVEFLKGLIEFKPAESEDNNIAERFRFICNCEICQFESLKRKNKKENNDDLGMDKIINSMTEGFLEFINQQDKNLNEKYTVQAYDKYSSYEHTEFNSVEEAQNQAIICIKDGFTKVKIKKVEG